MAVSNEAELEQKIKKIIISIFGDMGFYWSEQGRKLALSMKSLVVSPPCPTCGSTRTVSAGENLWRCMAADGCPEEHKPFPYPAETDYVRFKNWFDKTMLLNHIVTQEQLDAYLAAPEREKPYSPWSDEFRKGYAKAALDFYHKGYTEGAKYEEARLRRDKPTAPEEAWDEAAKHEKKWRELEKNYILPCFEWAKEYEIDLPKLVREKAGKNCVELLVRALGEGIAKLKDEVDTFMLAAMEERRKFIKFREHVDKNYIHRDNVKKEGQ